MNAEASLGPSRLSAGLDQPTWVAEERIQELRLCVFRDELRPGVLRQAG